MGLDVIKGHRLNNTKYPAITLFDDVASPEKFEILYAIQAMTNPRLCDEAGELVNQTPLSIVNMEEAMRLLRLRTLIQMGVASMTVFWHIIYCLK